MCCDLNLHSQLAFENDKQMYFLSWKQMKLTWTQVQDNVKAKDKTNGSENVRTMVT
jgi:hypothetical protein